MTKPREATEQELQEAWSKVEEFWEANAKHSDMLDYPWTRARFYLNVFKTTLSQRGMKVPNMMGGPL